MKFQIDNIFLFLLIVVLLSACYENQDGCLDILATNYDVTADIECDDNCCIYPLLSINLTQNEGSDAFSLKDTIVNNLGQEVVLLDLVYLMSDVSLTLDGENVYIPDSTCIIDVSMDTLLKPENFTRVFREKATYEIGEMREIGRVTAINFNIGLPLYMEKSTFLNEVTNDLTTDPDSLQADDLTYTVQRIQIAKGEEFMDTMIYEVPGSLGPKSVSIELDTTYDAGRAKLVSLSVDYERWFQDINFDTDSDTVIDSLLRLNLAESFEAN